jgi:hypothetical protein
MLKKKFDKKEYQRTYYNRHKSRIRKKSQEYYYWNRYGKTLEEIMQEKEDAKPKFRIIRGEFILHFD